MISTMDWAAEHAAKARAECSCPPEALGYNDMQQVCCTACGKVIELWNPQACSLAEVTAQLIKNSMRANHASA